MELVRTSVLLFVVGWGVQAPVWGGVSSGESWMNALESNWLALSNFEPPGEPPESTAAIPAATRALRRRGATWIHPMRQHHTRQRALHRIVSHMCMHAQHTQLE